MSKKFSRCLCSLIFFLNTGAVAIGYAETIQPSMDNVYGKTVQIGNGNFTLFDPSFSKSSFLDKVYATDAQQADIQSWTQNEVNGRPLNFGPNNTVNDGSVTWKFVAPPGETFTGGTIVLRGTTVWSGAKLSLTTHTEYSNNGSGYGGYRPGFGSVLQAIETAPPAQWQFTDWIVNVPVGTNSFFLTAAMRQDNSGAWGHYLKAVNVRVTSTMPPIVKTPLSSALPAQWTFWTAEPSHANASAVNFGSSPTGTALTVRMGNAGGWSLRPPNSFPVQPGQVWTLTGVVAGRNLGWIGNAGGGGLTIMSLNSSGNVVDWHLGTSWRLGTVSWEKRSVTVTVPDGVAYLLPAFEGYGGGEFFVNKVDFRMGSAATLSVPGTGFPPIQPNQDNQYGYSVQLNTGNQTLLNGSMSENDFIKTIYASDCQTENSQVWVTNESNGRPLNLGPNGDASDGSITWLLKAPPGTVFKGGTIQLRGTTVWGGSPIELRAHSAYSQNGSGIGGYTANNGSDLGMDLRGPAADWMFQDWKLNIPKDVPEFFLTASARKDIMAAWVNRITISDIQVLPPGWGFWAKTPEVTKISVVSESPRIIRLQSGDANGYRVDMPLQAVTEGETWNFSLLVADRKAGWIAGGGYNLQILGVKGSDEVALTPESWVNADQGIWLERRSSSISIPQGVTQVFCRLTGQSGGEVYIQNPIWSKTAIPVQTSLVGLPAMGVSKVIIPIATKVGGVDGIVGARGQVIRWTLSPLSWNTDMVDYKIKDAYGNLVTAVGTVRLKESVEFTPPSPGYYELELSGTLGMGWTVTGKSGVAVLPTPAAWIPGGNPFGVNVDGIVSLQRYGFTWTRPLYYDIQNGCSPHCQDRFPAMPNPYRDAWIAKRGTETFPSTYLNSFEIWNEADNEISLADGHLPFKYPGTSMYSNAMMEYALTVKAAGDGIRSLDWKFGPAKIGLNFAYWTPFRDFATTDLSGIKGKSLYDVASIHPYSQYIFKDHGQGIATAGSPEKDGLLSLLGTYAINVENVASLNQIPTAGQKEYWSTEFGWPTVPERDWSCSELNQARYMVRSSLLQLAFGFSRVMPFLLQDLDGRDERDKGFGMVRLDGSAKPSLVAYSILAQTIHDLPFDHRLDFGSNTAALVFGRTGSTVLALWNPDGERNLPLTFPPSANFKGETKLFGDTTSNYSGNVGRSPIFLKFQASPDQVANALGKAALRPGKLKLENFFFNVIDGPYDP